VKEVSLLATLLLLAGCAHSPDSGETDPVGRAIEHEMTSPPPPDPLGSVIEGQMK